MQGAAAEPDDHDRRTKLEPIKQFTAAALLRSVFLVTASTYVAYAAGLLASTLIARALGPEDYGRYAYIVWLSGVLVMLMNHGITTSLIRFISECIGRGDSSAGDAVYRWFWRRQWLSAVLVALLFAAVIGHATPAGWQGGLLMFGAAVLAASVPKAWYLFQVSAAKGHGRFGMEAGSLSALSLAGLLGAALLLWLRAGLPGFLLLFVALSLAHPLLLRFMRQRVVVAAGGPAPDEALLARVRPHFAWTALLVFAAAFLGPSVSMIFLNRHASAEAVGFFSLSASLTRGGVELLSAGLNSILMPLMAHGYGAAGAARTAAITTTAIRLFHFFGLLLTGVGLFWAAPIVLLLYGARYEPAIAVFQVLVVVGGLTLPWAVFGSLLSTTERQALRFGLTLGAVLLSVAAAWLLVPGRGLAGALIAYAVSTAVAYLVTAAVTVRQARLGLPWSGLIRLTLAALLSALVAAAPLLLHDGLVSKLLAGLLFAVLFVAGSIGLRAWTTAELALIETQAQRLGRAGWLLRSLQRFGRQDRERW